MGLLQSKLEVKAGSRGMTYFASGKPGRAMPRCVTISTRGDGVSLSGHAPRLDPSFLLPSRCPLADTRGSLIQQVKDANDIVDVIGNYVPLRQTGSTFKGLCPF